MSKSATKFSFGDASDKSESYEGGCHCGSISFTVELSPPLNKQKVVNCNCSICRRAGYLLVCTLLGSLIFKGPLLTLILDPVYEKVTWHNDSRARLSNYTFQTKTRDHMFCPQCGASIGIDFRENETKRYGISVSISKGGNIHG